MTAEQPQAAPQDAPQAEPTATTAQAPPPPAGAAHVPPPPAAAPASERRGITARHVVSVILSLFPGLGHIYNGLYQRGVVLFLLAVGSIILAMEVPGPMGMAVAFVWLFNMIDAYRQASLIELGYATDFGLEDAPKAPASGQLGLLAGIGLFVIGFLALLDYTFGYDIDRIYDFWPIGLLGVGAWLMIGAYVQWRRGKAEAETD